MSNASAIEEALANGWLDAEDLAALDRKPLEGRFRNEAQRQRFYGLSLEDRSVMLREMIWGKGDYERRDQDA